jgi:predicted RNA binding protein YcfA (HicA-like mRNA interferase family)
MKRGALLKKLHQAGVVFVKHESKHDLYMNPRTGAKDRVPRHSNVNEVLAKKIIQKLTN